MLAGKGRQNNEPQSALAGESGDADLRIIRGHSPRTFYRETG